ncbi:MAG: thiolase family protein [Syntrophales bacterium LBB04]|nr:thiolase family protein [Syntrophales bacterium LBB04]
MKDNDVVIVLGVRTPFSPFDGAMWDLPSIDLGAMVMKELLQRTSLKGESIDEVFYGMTMHSEAALYDNSCGRQALLKAGLPPETVSLTIDRACCSSMASAILAFRTIKAGEGEVFIAGGAENMSHAPQIAPPELRWGTRMGPIVFRDPMSPLGHTWIAGPEARNAGEVALEYGIGREEQDRWAFQSQMRYQDALKAGKYDVGGELMTVEVPQRKGAALIVDKDLFPRPETTVESLSKLKTVYESPTVTAGNAPGLDTGASGLVIMTRRKAKEFALVPIASILATSSVCTPPRFLAVNPGFAIKKLIKKAEIGIEAIDLFEINEAFAAVPLVSSKILGDGDDTKTGKIRERLNVNGGAIAIGHPVGASGTRLIMTLMYELRRRGGGLGVAGICGGISQGDSVLIKVD